MTKSLQIVLAVLAATVIWFGAIATAGASHLTIGAEAEVASDDNVNLRVEPAVDARVVTLIGPAKYVYVLDGPRWVEDTAWYQVEFDGDRGWIRGDLLVPARARTSSRGDRAASEADQRTVPGAPPGVRVGSEASVITDDGLNLRVKPSTGAPIMELVKNAGFVFVIDGPVENDEGIWYKVEFDGSVGWVAGGFLGPATRAAVARSGPRIGGLSAPPGANIGQSIANRARQFVGMAYAWGGSSPSTGFDCSGLVRFVMAEYGINPGRTADDQAGAGYSVKSQDLLPGDIVVFANTYGPGYTHDGIYIGGGQFVHAEDWDTGVVISSVFGGYWGRHYAGARRAW